MSRIEVTSFGYGHSPAPDADVIIDARRHFRNPHQDPQMRFLTGLDDPVRRHVLATPGVMNVVRATAQTVVELVPVALTPVTVGVGCVGGRHRSVAMAEALSAELRRLGLDADVVHRDVRQPVIQK